ncbi:MAG: hypothetical protein RIB93_11885 [Coleofasciculus sp. D1-CHI-01]|uniref:hypothetical protein n=1 Tax=Coleofasciculus sp. D1-CHI-01 TaxID=3068482 RepID=UPI0032F10BE5
MPVNRIVLLCVVGGGLAIFVLSNLSAPALSIVFLGMQTVALPLTVWIGLAIALGILTSLVLQLLSFRPRRVQRFDRTAQASPPNRWRSDVEFEQEEPEPQETEPEMPSPPPPPPPPPPEPPPSASGSDWDQAVAPEWNFEGESATSIEDEFDWDEFESQPEEEVLEEEETERDRQERSIGSDRSSYEPRQEPSLRSQPDSVYSYSYRESNTSKSRIGKSEAVYDANYRVITPPYRQPPPQAEPEDEDENEGEDWGFEFDEQDRGS